MRGKHSDEPVFDHNGKPFYSLKEMCKFWKVNSTTYLTRLKNGWSQEKALTVKTRRYYRRVNVLDVKPVVVPNNFNGETRMTVREIKKLIKGLDDSTELLILTALPV